MTDRERDLVGGFLNAKFVVIAEGFEGEIDWQEQAAHTPLTEQRFMREGAWVILNSGMRESVVRKVFPEVCSGYDHFTSASVARDAGVQNRRRILATFGHHRKIAAIQQLVDRVNNEGMETVSTGLAEDPINYLRSFAFIGPVTAYHLAKNIGLPVAKPDRHLVRMAAANGFDDAHQLCAALSELVGDPIPVVDIVLWRFATLNHDWARTSVNRQVSARLSLTEVATELPLADA